MHPLLKKLALTQSAWLKKSKNSFTTINPATGKAIAAVAATTPAQYQAVLKQAQAAFLQWRLVPAPKRGEIVRQIGAALREKKSLLGSLISLEVGKSKQEGDGEVQEMIDMVDFAVGQSRMLYGKTMPSEREQHRLFEQWQPLGTVGVITAFNFPMAVWAWNAFLAAICGDTVIWKPSRSAALCAIAVQKICDEVLARNKVPAIFSLIIPQDKVILDDFIDNPAIKLLSFTGSSAVGKKVNARVAARMGRSILECSGNNAIIVDDTADLKLVVPAVVFGAVGTAGQRCTSTRRLFLHEKIYDRVVASLVAAYKKIKIGDPLDEKNHMGPLIDEAAVAAFSQAVACAKQQGGQMLYGGKALDQVGFFVQPTIIAAKNNYAIVQAETFAPILFVMKYQNFAQAVAMQNDVVQGLSSACFTTNLKHAEFFLAAQGSDCGIANINIGTSGAEIGGAFGGEKETGGGREAGSDAWKQYMRRQTNTINWGDALPLAQGIRFEI